MGENSQVDLCPGGDIHGEDAMGRQDNANQRRSEKADQHAFIMRGWINALRRRQSKRSLRELAWILNCFGLRTRRGSEFQARSVSRILKRTDGRRLPQRLVVSDEMLDEASSALRERVAEQSEGIRVTFR
jgi:hypothetical protein